MKEIFLISFAMVLFAFNSNAQTKKDGTPDMRFKANKQNYGTSYTAPTYSAPKSSTPSSTVPSYKTPKTTIPSYTAPKTTERNYNNGGQYKIQNGYQKSNGTYVAPHIKTSPDNKTWNNFKKK